MENTEMNLQGDYEKTFSSRLRKLMDDGHISQQKLADFLGLKNRQSVASYCNGRSTPDLESIIKIASFFLLFFCQRYISCIKKKSSLLKYVN